MMFLSSSGIDLIKGFEGLRLNAYKDGAGVWTIGYGSTRYVDNKPVLQHDKLASIKEATAIFAETLKEYERAVNAGVHVTVNQNQFDALVSITYNVGTGIMKNSALVAKLNAGDYAGAADQFLAWDKITDPITHQKAVCDTLLKRRKIERGLFLTPYIYDTQKR